MKIEVYLYCFRPSGESLSDNDKRDGQRAGAYLAASKAGVNTVYYHDSPECLELTHKLVKAMGRATDCAKPCDISTPDFLRKAFSEVQQQSASVERVLCIAPENKMKTLRQSFHFGETEILFTDALIQLMSCDDGNSWSSGFVLPRSELPSKFPFPTPDGPELRDRPAYYYTQSAVIPFQRGKDGLTILLIGSSKRKHLVVPKGIHEPGLSAQDSAAIESMEEAGVRGPVSAKAIGSYSYAKWGAECTVTVYVQEVVELLTEEQWEESHRGRQWLVPEVAAARVKEPHLGRMIGRVEEFVNREFL